MTKRLLSVLFLCVAAASSQAQNLHQEIQAVYNKWDRLAMKLDLNAMVNFLDPTFVQVDAEGNRMTRAQVVEHMKSYAGTVREMKSRITVEQVQRSGDEVTAYSTMNISFKAKQGNKWTPMKFSMKFAETLVKRPNGWKFIFSQALP